MSHIEVFQSIVFFGLPRHFSAQAARDSGALTVWRTVFHRTPTVGLAVGPARLLCYKELPGRPGELCLSSTFPHAKSTASSCTTVPVWAERPPICNGCTTTRATGRKGKMISLATETDRTLFFDFLPLDLGTVRGFKTPSAPLHGSGTGVLRSQPQADPERRGRRGVRGRFAARAAGRQPGDAGKFEGAPAGAQAGLRHHSLCPAIE